MIGFFILGLILLTGYLTIRFLARISAWISGSRFRAYRALAARYRGKYENRGLSDPPTVSFLYNGANIRVGLAPHVVGQTYGPRTRVVARFSTGLPIRLELAPASRQSPPQPPKGTRPVRLGDVEFDRGFNVQANDPDMARAFLGPEVRNAIQSLQRFSPPSGMLLSINPERLLVQVDRNLAQHHDSLLEAVRLALLVHDGLQVGVASRLGQGISILAAGPSTAEDAGPPICKVCGDPIHDPEVVCMICRTPHHRDCWEFVGSCSIYGCKGQESVPA